jgi:plastocyanin
VRRWTCVAAAAAAVLAAGVPSAAQSTLDRSPSLAGTWTLPSGNAAFVLGHRFEFLFGGNEMINFPTLTAAVGLPLGLTAGVDFTSNSEIVPDKLGGNETAVWLKRALPLAAGTEVAAIVGYNTAARGPEGAASARSRVGPVSLFGEGRVLGRAYGEPDPGAAATAGAMLHLTRYLGLTGDVGTVFFGDARPAVWSAGVAFAIPGSPHSMTLHATNGGATTLHGAAREKVIGPQPRRYGFTFTVPLGTGAQWARIFRGDPPPRVPPALEASAGGAADTVAATVEIRQVVFAPRVVRIRAGQAVEWVNHEPLVHSVDAQDGSWGSGLLNEGDRFVQRFDRPGRYRYHCAPHPQMRGEVVVTR